MRPSCLRPVVPPAFRLFLLTLSTLFVLSTLCLLTGAPASAQLPTVYPGVATLNLSVGHDLGNLGPQLTWEVTTVPDWFGSNHWPQLVGTNIHPNGWMAGIVGGTDVRGYPSIQITVPSDAATGDYQATINDPNFHTYPGPFSGSGNFQSEEFQVVSGPSELAAAAGNGQVSLTWTAAAGVLHYEIYRGTTSGGETAYAPATTNSFVDGNAANGVTYYYKVVAVDQWGSSVPTNEVSASPTSEVGAPPAPTGLTAVAGNAEVVLTWTGTSAATSYNVYAGTSSGGEGTQAVYSAGTTSATIGYTLAFPIYNGETYYFEVTSVNSGGESGKSIEVSATPQSPGANAAEMPPGGAILTATTEQNVSMPTMSGIWFPWEVLDGSTVLGSAEELDAGWDAYYDQPDKFSTTGPLTSDLVDIQAPEGFSQTNNLEARVTDPWWYGGTKTLTSNNFGIPFDVVNSIEYPTPPGVEVTDNGYIPGEGYSVTISPIYGPGNTGFFVYRSAYGIAPTHNPQLVIPYAQWGSPFGGGAICPPSESVNDIVPPGASVEYSDTAVYNVQYGIVPINDPLQGYAPTYYVESDFSTPNYYTAPPQPPVLSGTVGDNSAILNWSTVQADSYNLYRGASSGGEGSTPYITGITQTNYTDSGLTNGTPYYYKVTAVENGVEGGKSNEVEVTPQVTDESLPTNPQCVPVEMAAGQTYNVTVTMQNKGTSAWVPGTYYLVPGSQNTIPWNVQSVSLPSNNNNGDVVPGDSATFTFQVTAPSNVSPPDYVFDAAMSDTGNGGIFELGSDLVVDVDVVTGATYADQYGTEPEGPLMQASDGCLYGMTNTGGANTYYGTVYRYNPVCGCVATIYSFEGSSKDDGANPTWNWLVQDAKGKLYGTTPLGQYSPGGTIFQIDPATGSYAVLWQFSSGLNIPRAGLTIDSQGNFFGTGSASGNGGAGGVFEFDMGPLDEGIATYNWKQFNATNEYNDVGGITIGADSQLYGVSAEWGPVLNSYEAVYSVSTVTGLSISPFGYDTPSSYTSDQVRSYGHLVCDASNNLYGTTYNLPTPAYPDTVFAIAQSHVAPSGSSGIPPTILHSFTNTSTDGDDLNDGVILVPVGTGTYLYGLAEGGGSTGDGTLFVLTTDGSNLPNSSSPFMVLHTFSGSDGRSPEGSLLLASDGSLYGTCSAGGTNSGGTLFKYTPSTPTTGTFSVVYNFGQSHGK